MKSSLLPLYAKTTENSKSRLAIHINVYWFVFLATRWVELKKLYWVHWHKTFFFCRFILSCHRILSLEFSFFSFIKRAINKEHQDHPMEQLINQGQGSTVVPHWRCCGFYHDWVREVKEQDEMSGICSNKITFMWIKLQFRGD